jgi:hypothetical protein
MKKKILLILAITVLGLTSCVTTKDPWGNKQTWKERRALNEIGCPNNQQFIGVH